MPDVAVLTVHLHGKPIGTLTHLGSERSVFSFHDAYIESNDRPTLSLNFKDRYGDLITEFRPTKRKLAPFFSNLLPEGPLRRYLSELAGIHEQREFFLLWVLGRDLPGAVTVEPADRTAKRGLPPALSMKPTARPRLTPTRTPCVSLWPVYSSNSRRSPTRPVA
jgi:serine/threonine-protein kinase HipA